MACGLCPGNFSSLSEPGFLRCLLCLCKLHSVDRCDMDHGIVMPSRRASSRACRSQQATGVRSQRNLFGHAAACLLSMPKFCRPYRAVGRGIRAVRHPAYPVLLSAPRLVRVGGSPFLLLLSVRVAVQVRYRGLTTRFLFLSAAEAQRVCACYHPSRVAAISSVQDQASTGVRHWGCSEPVSSSGPIVL